MFLCSVKYEVINKDRGDQKWVWDDRGSGADENVSFWRIYPENGFYPLGDTACKNWSRCRSMIRVKDVSEEQNLLRKDGFQNEKIFLLINIKYYMLIILCIYNTLFMYTPF